MGVLTGKVICCEENGLVDTIVEYIENGMVVRILCRYAAVFSEW